MSCDRPSDGRGDSIGEALVPYYHQILPVFNIFLHKNGELATATIRKLRRMYMYLSRVPANPNPNPKNTTSNITIRNFFYSFLAENLGDTIDYSQRRRENLGDLITETLQALETCGGKVSYLSLSFIVVVNFL